MPSVFAYFHGSVLFLRVRAQIHGNAVKPTSHVAAAPKKRKHNDSDSDEEEEAVKRRKTTKAKSSKYGMPYLGRLQ